MELPTWLVVSLGAFAVLVAVVWGMTARKSGVRTVHSGPARAREPSKIERIKQYREQHGVGLKQAKEAVEALERGEHVAAPPAPAAPADVAALLHAGNMIGAIKAYREQTGVGLKEAKEAVERMRDER